VIASPVVRGRSRGRGVAVRGGHVVRSSVNVIPRPAVVATVATPRHASTAESYVSSDCKTCDFFNKIWSFHFTVLICKILQLLG
jgi:hypothetical protein